MGGRESHPQEPLARKEPDMFAAELNKRLASREQGDREGQRLPQDPEPRVGEKDISGYPSYLDHRKLQPFFLSA